MVQLNFNASGVKPNAALEPVPTGIYPVTITKSEKKPTKSGNGSYIELEMTIAGGEFANRKVFDRLNIENPNQTAVDIAYATLSAICHVTGRIQIQDTSQLHGVPFMAVVSKIERNDQPGTFSNEVKGYKDVNGNDPGFGGQVAQQNAQPSWAQNGANQSPQAPGNTYGNGPSQPQNNGAWQGQPQGNQQPQGNAPQNPGQQPQGGDTPPWGAQQQNANNQPPNSVPPQQNGGAAPNGQGNVPPAGPAGAATDAPPWAS